MVIGSEGVRMGDAEGDDDADRSVDVKGTCRNEFVFEGPGLPCSQPNMEVVLLLSCSKTLRSTIEPAEVPSLLTREL